MHSLFRSFVTVSALGIGGLLAACSHDKEVPAPALGTITGTVSVFDETGEPVTAGGVTVTVGSGAQQRTATTDATGAFRLEDLPMEKYALVFTRSDVGTSYQATELNEQRRSAMHTIKLGQPSSTRVTSLTFEGFDTSSAKPAVKLRQDVVYNPQLHPQGLYFLNMYFSDTPSVSASNYKLKGSGGGNVYPAASSIPVSWLQEAGFASGTKVYVVAYGAARNEIVCTAPVPATAPRGITTNLNTTPSNVVNFIMP